MSIFEFSSYKEAIQAQLAHLKSKGAAISLRKISEALAVQYTYLSRVMHNEKAHLNEDQVWTVGQLLKLHESEVDFLLLLRSWEICQSSRRKDLLYRKLQSIRKASQLNAQVSEIERLRLDREMEYLLDPYCMLIYISLHIGEYQKALQKLRLQLSLDESKFTECISKLENLNLIHLNTRRTEVLSLQKAHMHYSLEHPLMRVHQAMMRQLCQSRLLQTSEKNKKSFMVSFASDEKSYEKIRDEFQAFVKRVEEIVIESKARHTYQLSFDLFRWL